MCKTLIRDCAPQPEARRTKLAPSPAWPARARLGSDGTEDTLKLCAWGAIVAITLLFSRPLFCDEIDRYVESRIRELHIPGASIAVVRDGKLVKAQGYGRASLELNAPATKSTVYEIGSNTKQFTAAAVMLLVEEGKVGLDDTLTKYFPATPPAWKDVTVRHLLTHTSGIRNHVGVPGYMDVFRTNLSFETTPARDELLRMFFELPLEFQPGETWAYDNTGYYLLGVIIEKASGQSYWSFLETRIFKPLGMTSTRSTDPRPVVANRALGYGWTKGSFENRPVLYPAIAFSAGSMLSTVEDLAKWDAALGSDALLRRSTRELMWTPAAIRGAAPAPFDYGFGWFVDTYNGRRVVLHSGGTPGFSSAIHRWIDDGITVVVLTNHTDRIVDQLAVDIAGLADASLRRPEKGDDPEPATSTRLEGIVRRYLEARPDPADFTPPMQLFMKTTTGPGLAEWIASHGKLGSFVYSGSEQAGRDRILRYRITLGGSPYWLSVRLTENGKVAQIRWW
ncbi:MAG: beta-lactamase family protein [Thermoanaerobaculia bacterium]|nr:beta-lactamase family protein [Thermoanaerobaculia bacterium]